jgi:hypothetical protein
MTPTEALIFDLSADLASMQRREAGGLLALDAAELAIILLARGMRPDMGQMIISPHIVCKIGSLAFLAIVGCTGDAILYAAYAVSPWPGVDLGGSRPGNRRRSVRDVNRRHSRSLLDRLPPVHGMMCAVSTVVLALPIIGLRAVLMRRSARCIQSEARLRWGSPHLCSTHWSSRHAAR